MTSSSWSSSAASAVSAPGSRRPLVIGIIGITATVLLGIVIRVSGNGPTNLDSAWHDLMLAWRTRPGVDIARALDVAGGVSAMMSVGVILTIVLLFARRPWGALAVAGTMVLSEVATGTLKLLFARPRPTDSLSDVGLTSFPSGHTTLAAATTIALALVLGRAFWIVAAVWVTAIAWSRTFLEAHWLTDVVAGAVLGASIASLVWWLLCTVRRSARQHRSRSSPSALESSGRG
jgi:membrane-associated phospholipid phosphatase